MRPAPFLLIAAAWLTPYALQAEPAFPMPSEIRLSDEEKEKVLEAAAESRRATSIAGRGAAEVQSTLPPVHGEVSFAVGTGGYRSARGTAVVPLEGGGTAIISLGSTDFGSRDRYLETWPRP